jgi:hypothetical protein
MSLSELISRSFDYSGLSIRKAGAISKRAPQDGEQEAAQSTATTTSSTSASGAGTASSTASAPSSTTSIPPAQPSSELPVQPVEAPPIPTPTGGIGGNPFLFETALTVSFTVVNRGDLDGHEVAQVYLGFPQGAGEPPKLLRGFERKLIKKGASEKFDITLRNKELAIWYVLECRVPYMKEGSRG